MKLQKYQVVLYFFIAVIPQFFVDCMTDVITLSCHASHMSVDVDLRYFTSWLDPHSLHLQDDHCKPHYYDRTKASFKVPLQGCGTSQLKHEHLLIFSNAVRNSDKNSTNEISRVPRIRLPFGCRYQNRYSFVVSGGGSESEKERVYERKIPQSKKTTVPQDLQERPSVMISGDHYPSGIAQIVAVLVLIACIFST